MFGRESTRLRDPLLRKELSLDPSSSSARLGTMSECAKPQPRRNLLLTALHRRASKVASALLPP